VSINWKLYAEVAGDVLLGLVAYHLGGWIGFALWVFFVIAVAFAKLVAHQEIMSKTLLSRLPDRCAMCHREIVDEGGVVDKEGIFHEVCLEKREANLAKNDPST
jgi:hypothetical protein